MLFRWISLLCIAMFVAVGTAGAQEADDKPADSPATETGEQPAADAADEPETKPENTKEA
jgi:hypothetical protein